MNMSPVTEFHFAYTHCGQIARQNINPLPFRNKYKPLLGSLDTPTAS